MVEQIPLLYILFSNFDTSDYITKLCAFQIAFLGARILPDGRTAVLMSGRTDKSFQSLGINRHLTSKLSAYFPNVTRVMFHGSVNDDSQKTRSTALSHYLWVSNVSQNTYCLIKYGGEIAKEGNT